MHGQGVLKSACQLTCRHFAHRRLVRANGCFHQLPNTRAMASGDEVQRYERNEIELESELSMDRLALLLRNTVPFVHCDDQCPPSLESDAEHAGVLFGHCVVGVQNENDDMCFVDRLQG